MRKRRIAVGLIMMSLLWGCGGGGGDGDDSPTSGVDPSVNLSGDWQASETIIYEGEAIGETYTYPTVITQQGDQVSITDPDGLNLNALLAEEPCRLAGTYPLSDGHFCEYDLVLQVLDSNHLTAAGNWAIRSSEGQYLPGERGTVNFEFVRLEQVGQPPPVVGPAPQEGTYSGEITVDISYANSPGGEIIRTETYNHSGAVVVKAPLVGDNFTESNPINLQIMTLPMETADYPGQTVIYSAASSSYHIGPPGMTPLGWYQFWEITQNGTQIEGTLVDNHKFDFSTPWANYTKYITSWYQLLVAGPLDNGSTLSGTIDSERASLTVEGWLAVGSVGDFCHVRIKVEAALQ